MNHTHKFCQQIAFAGCAPVVIGFCFFLTGCQSPDSINGMNAPTVQQSLPENSPTVAKALTLHEGDVVKVTFTGAPDLNSIQPVRRDGKITVALAGEVTAAGLTPTDLEKEIIRLCGSQLISKEVVVTLESSLFPVFVTGAVIRPGKVMSDRPITALQAIMEAGGFDYTKANLTSVRVIREEGGKVKNYQFNLKLVLQGKRNDPFDLKPADIVYVPTKFSWF